MLTRRALLAVPAALSAAVGLAACSDQPTPTVDPQLAADHDALVLALDVERGLAALVDAAPGDRLPAGAAEAVSAHVQALATTVGSPSPTATPSTSVTPSPPGRVAAAATEAARSHLNAVPEVTGPVARLLASVAASDLALAAAAGGPTRLGRSPGSLPDAADAPLVDAWQSALTAEQQAHYAYQVAAARLLADGADEAQQAETGVEVHRARVDRASTALAGLAATPSPPEAGYALPTPLDDVAAAAGLLADVERACAAAAADVVAASDAAARQLPVGWLVGSAQAEADWSGEIPALPGLDGRTG